MRRFNYFDVSFNYFDVSLHRFSKRRKRQDDGGIFGGLLKTMFGVAYSGEVSQVSSRLDSIDSRLSQDIGGVRNSHSELAQR